MVLYNIPLATLACLDQPLRPMVLYNIPLATLACLDQPLRPMVLYNIPLATLACLDQPLRPMVLYNIPLATLACLDQPLRPIHYNSRKTTLVVSKPLKFWDNNLLFKWAECRKYLKSANFYYRYFLHYTSPDQPDQAKLNSALMLINYRVEVYTSGPGMQTCVDMWA